MSCSCRVLPSPAAWRVSRQPCTCRTHASCCRFRVETGPTLELVTELATLQPETRQYYEVTRRSVLRPQGQSEVSIEATLLLTHLPSVLQPWPPALLRLMKRSGSSSILVSSITCHVSPTRVVS